MKLKEMFEKYESVFWVVASVLLWCALFFNMYGALVAFWCAWLVCLAVKLYLSWDKGMFVRICYITLIVVNCTAIIYSILM